MTRDKISTALLKNIGETLPDVDVDGLDTSLSMKEIGANSLDMVEIVSRTMRQLKVKIPRSELNTVQNIDGLIDLIERSANG